MPEIPLPRLPLDDELEVGATAAEARPTPPNQPRTGTGAAVPEAPLPHPSRPPLPDQLRTSTGATAAEARPPHPTDQPRTDTGGGRA